MNQNSQRRIKTLTPQLRSKATDFLRIATIALQTFNAPWNKYSVEITEAARSLDYQIWLYLKGRKYDPSKREYAKRKGGEKIVTNAILESNHLVTINQPFSHAFDVALYNPVKHRYIWPNPRHREPNIAKKAKRLWLRLADIGKELGLKPGAYWRSPDFPHFEE